MSTRGVSTTSVNLNKQSVKTRIVHRIRLEASTNVARFLLKFGLFFQGYKSESSLSEGLFLGFLNWLEKIVLGYE